MRFHPYLASFGLILVTFFLRANADGPIDNQDAQVRRIPPIGIELSCTVQMELEQLVAELDRRIPRTENVQKTGPIDWWNDVRVISRAVKLTIEGRQFANDKDVDQARQLLKLGQQRADELTTADGKLPHYAPSWAKQSGRVIAGHRSRLDDTVQPFGILVPKSAIDDPKKPRRLDIWLHGRDENVSEVGCLYRRWMQDSPYLPDDAFVLQPWGRYSNAFRFAGEVDVFEALAEVERRYAIDPDRICIRGFSMGGAGCWNLATHHPDRFAAANPGAGFCETERFLTGFQSEVLKPSAAQRRLWGLYDCPPIVRNLIHLPTIAYSGGQDRQKEAADIMTEAAKQAKFTIPYVIHPESAHAIHPDAKKEIEAKMVEFVKQGRVRFPKTVAWSTYTLRHPGAYWLRLTGLQKHWEKATLGAIFADDWQKLSIEAKNIQAFEIDLPFQDFLKSTEVANREIAVEINNQKIGGLRSEPDGTFKQTFEFKDGAWKVLSKSSTASSPSLQKRPGLQGPIDDAFMDRFLVVRPTGISTNTAIDAWVDRELRHFIEHWRAQFRGDVRIKSDDQVTDRDLLESNLICFGTPTNNRLIARMIQQLPLRWTDQNVTIGSHAFDASKCIPVLIYPNPLAPEKYVVFNSGFTYREYDYLNNARQTPKLPDWALIDAQSPMTTRAAGTILAEGFFDERWKP